MLIVFEQILLLYDKQKTKFNVLKLARVSNMIIEVRFEFLCAACIFNLKSSTSSDRCKAIEQNRILPSNS